jgi:hypothetical protein
MSLQDALDITMKMALSIPLADIMAYRKVGKAFFGLLEVLCANHTGVIAACDTATFTFLLTALDAGLKSLDVVRCTLQLMLAGIPIITVYCLAAAASVCQPVLLTLVLREQGPHASVLAQHVLSHLVIIECWMES